MSSDDEQEENSTAPLETINKDFRSVLDDFREKWQHELHNDQQQQPPTTNEAREVNQKEYDNEQKARTLFLQGVELEKQRKVFEAMSLYRKAVQLVPDIEFKIYERNKVQKNDQQQQQHLQVPAVEEVFEEDREVAEDEDENLDGVDLVARFQDFLGKVGNFCSRSVSNKTVIGATGGAHFGDLPVEIVLYILRWVVSSHLDMRSLEQSSLVCKGMYLCARDPEIWKLACLKVWGLNLGTLTGSPFDSWRHMYLQRPRIHFNGCYISKTSYLRYGENSFQDQSYRPIQLVEYYRYLRFFPDGTCLMMTTADEPQMSVSRLNNRNLAQNEVITGHYRLSDDTVIAVMKRTRQSQKQQRLTHRRRGSNIIGLDADTGLTTFYQEMSIVSTEKRRFAQLHWKNYSIISVKNCRETKTDFDLTAAKYPPLWFSRVKSYHLESEVPLN